MTSTNPKSKVAAFLNSKAATRSRGGPRCQTCSHPNAEFINSTLKEFGAARSKGDTTVPWSTFVKNTICVDPDYAYELNWRSLLAHAEKCCGFEI